MKHEDLRTDEQKFDDLLADGHSLSEISFHMGWSRYRVGRHYREICHKMGEQPDADI